MTLRPSLRRFYIEKFMSIMNLQLEGEPDVKKPKKEETLPTAAPAAVAEA